VPNKNADLLKKISLMRTEPPSRRTPKFGSRNKKYLSIIMSYKKNNQTIKIAYAQKNRLYKIIKKEALAPKHPRLNLLIRIRPS